MHILYRTDSIHRVHRCVRLHHKTFDLCYRTALEVWRLILEETEKLGKARLQVADIMQEQIAEPLKPYRMAKQHIHKRVGDGSRGGGEV